MGIFTISLGELEVLMKRGFTLVELLVVIAIIGMLVGLLLPAVQQARAAARLTMCTNNIHQLALAVQNYESARKEFPPGVDGTDYYTSGTPDRSGHGSKAGQGSYGLFANILPYVDQMPLYQMIDFDVAARDYQQGSRKNTATGQALMQTVISAYMCPDYSQAKIGTVSGNFYGAVSCYAGCAGVKWTSSDNSNKGAKDKNNYKVTTEVESSSEGNISRNGMFFWGGTVKMRMVKDGLSNTFMLLETTPKKAINLSGYRWAAGSTSQGTCLTRNWLLGANITGKALYDARQLQLELNKPPTSNLGGAPFNDQMVGSEHSGGAVFAMGDGSSKFIVDGIDFYTYRILATRNGEDKVLSSDF